MPTTNEALLRAGAGWINSIAAVFDYGGATKRLRVDSRGREIAYSDVMRSLLSLIPPNQLETKKAVALRELLKKRAWDRVLGHDIFSHFYDEKDGFTSTQTLLEDLTGIKFKGKILPVSTKSSNIVFETSLGRIHAGEDALDDQRMSKDSVVRMWLDPKVEGYPTALEAIQNAEIIVFSPGSLHGSILCNFLPTGVKEALRASNAKKYYLTNLASTRNETHEATPVSLIELFKRYSGLNQPIDAIIVPEMSRLRFEKDYPEIVRRYETENSHYLGWEDRELYMVLGEGIEVITHQATIVEPHSQTLRHDPSKLSETFKQILSSS